MRYWKKNDSIFVAVVLLLIAVLSVWLYYDFTARIDVGDRTQIGTITFKRRVAQRKLEGQVVWETAEEEIALYNRDSIRTAEASEATIELLDGTKIEVDASSMIVLNIDEGKFDINFAYGSIGATGAGSDLTIKSEGREIKLDGKANLSKGEGKDLDLVVKDGNASLKTEDGKENKLGKNQKAELSEDGVKIETIRLIPTAPADNRRFVSESGSAGVNFGWQPVQGGVTLQVSTNRGFSNLVVSQRAGGNAAAANLNEGVYYWRIAARNPKTNKTDYSATRRLSVLTSKPLQAVSPAAGASFPYVDRAPLVNFTWTRDELLGSYTLNVADNPGFSGAQSQNSRSNSLALRLEPGTYYWRVSGKNGLTGATVTSGTRSFTVNRAEKPPAPAPIQPENGRRVLRAAMATNALSFNWNRARGSNATRIQIASDAGFGNLIVNESTASNFYGLSRELGTGTYYWRLQGESEAGDSDWSGARQFVVIDSEKLVLLQPTPNQAIDAATARNGVRFAWKRPSLTGQFRLTIAGSPRFDRNPSTTAVDGLVHTRQLPAGEYYWKVEMVDGDRELASSDTGSFKVTDTPEPPALITPRRRENVDMNRRDELTFVWRGSDNATAYILRVYDLKNGRRKIFETTVRGTRYALRDLSVLDEGRFAWSLQAMGPGGRESASEEEFQDFTISLDSDFKQPNVTSPEVQFIN